MTVVLPGYLVQNGNEMSKGEYPANIAGECHFRFLLVVKGKKRARWKTNGHEVVKEK